MIGKLKKMPDGRKFRTFGWFKLNHVDVIKSPPYSPDLNPIENLFSIVKKNSEDGGSLVMKICLMLLEKPGTQSPLIC